MAYALRTLSWLVLSGTSEHSHLAPFSLYLRSEVFEAFKLLQTWIGWVLRKFSV